MLKIIPLGGTREIGLNMTVIEYGNTAFAIDAGLMFPEDYMLGVDIVLPDISYIKEIRKRFAAIVLTHGHEDHIGAIPFLIRDVNVPIFGTPFTIELVRQKLEEAGLAANADLHSISMMDELIRIGPFEIDFIRVNHSVVDGAGLAIETPVGTIIHSGDFKISQSAFSWMNTDVDKFAWYGKKGVLALMSDSTNVEREGRTVSDMVVGERLESIMARCSGRIIVALFASNIVRIQQIVDIAERYNRKVAFDGRSIEMSTRIAKNLGYLDMQDNIEIGISQINEMPDDEVVIITTGSQGEPMSSLARMAAGNNKIIKTKPGDTIILSSKFIPGNEKAITSLINRFYDQGADVVYETISDIHVSGHAFRDELRQMIRLVRPSYFIPIHGERRHIVLHSRLAQDEGVPAERTIIPDNGVVIELDGKTATPGSSVNTGRVLVDGKGVGDVGGSVLRERKALSEDGLVIVVMVFDEETGVVIHGPEIMSRGFLFENIKGHILEDAQCVILEIVEEVPPETPDRTSVIESQLKSALRQYFKFTIKRYPVVIPIIIEV